MRVSFPSLQLTARDSSSQEASFATVTPSTFHQKPSMREICSNTKSYP